MKCNRKAATRCSRNAVTHSCARACDCALCHHQPKNLAKNFKKVKLNELQRGHERVSKQLARGSLGARRRGGGVNACSIAASNSWPKSDKVEKCSRIPQK